MNNVIVVFWVVLAAFSIVPVAAESYYNPWAYSISIEAKNGDRVIAVVERMISAASERLKDDVKGDTYHEASKIRVVDEGGGISDRKFSVNKIYSGPVGVALFEVLADFGCGFMMAENEDGKSYSLEVRHYAPSSKHTVFIQIPELWRAELEHFELGKVLDAKGFPPKQFDLLSLSKDRKFLLAIGRQEACLKLYYSSQHTE